MFNPIVPSNKESVPWPVVPISPAPFMTTLIQNELPAVPVMTDVKFRLMLGPWWRSPA